MSTILTIIQPGHSPREFEVTEDLVSIGRASDNTISLQDNTNVSRYHAEIERRGEEFFLIDLGSSNGPTLNDQAVEFERKLQDGDLICIGNSTNVEFRHSAPARKANAGSAAANANPATQPGSANQAVNSPASDLADAVVAIQPPLALPSASGPPIGLIVGGIAGGLVLTALAALLIVGLKSRSSCGASVQIASPQSGTTLRGPTPIRLNVTGADCIERVIYQIDGVEVASVDISPYEVVLDPAQLRSVSSGNHTLSVSVEETGGTVRNEGSVLIALETGGSGLPTPAPSDSQPAGDSTPTLTIQDPGVDIRALSDRLAGQISRKSGYVFDRDFVELIRSRSGEYRVSGYSEKARRYRREINKAFRDQGLHPLLGYMLAMSRSKFNESARSEGVGLWQIPTAVAQAQGYLTAGETEETLKDPRRSSEIAAAYTKALVSTFESDDFMYAVACFGLPLSQAGLVRTQLATQAPDPIARRDFFKMVKLGVVKGDQVDRVVRFFAAGITTENPQLFGLPNDQPFSSLF